MKIKKSKKEAQAVDISYDFYSLWKFENLTGNAMLLMTQLKSVLIGVILSFVEGSRGTFFHNYKQKALPWMKKIFAAAAKNDFVEFCKKVCFIR